MGLKLEKSWHSRLQEELAKSYITDLKGFLQSEEDNGAAVYPPKSLVFGAFSQTPFENVKVVIVGQDPYHGPGQAHGLSFSVPSGVTPPPSLKNIFKELEDDVHIRPPTSGCLTSWAKQGVLLLNATLTVRANEPKSHYGKGWEQFTDRVIRELCLRKDPLVFLLWGKSAQDKYRHLINEKEKHAVLMAAHPSPFSAHSGFFGCKHFSKTNQFLTTWGKTPIDWNVTNTH